MNVLRRADVRFHRLFAFKLQLRHLGSFRLLLDGGSVHRVRIKAYLLLLLMIKLLLIDGLHQLLILNRH